jgi:hypothetical protein
VRRGRRSVLGSGRTLVGRWQLRHKIETANLLVRRSKQGFLHASAKVRASRRSCSRVLGRAGLPGPRCCHGCCQMRRLSNSASEVRPNRGRLD